MPPSLPFLLSREDDLSTCPEPSGEGEKKKVGKEMSKRGKGRRGEKGGEEGKRVKQNQTEYPPKNVILGQGNR